jgi:hypothetical protein
MEAWKDILHVSVDAGTNFPGPVWRGISHLFSISILNLMNNDIWDS